MKSAMEGSAVLAIQPVSERERMVSRQAKWRGSTSSFRAARTGGTSSGCSFRILKPNRAVHHERDKTVRHDDNISMKITHAIATHFFHIETCQYNKQRHCTY